MRRYWTLICLTALAWCGCTKQIEFRGTETEPLPVMVSYAEADSVLRVRMTMSKFFLSSERPPVVRNARFAVELNGRPAVAAFVYDTSGIYRSNLVLHEGDTLTLTAMVPDHGEMKAGCRVPMRPRVTDFQKDTADLHVDTMWNVDTAGNMTVRNVSIYGNIHFKYTLDDPAGDNCYLLRAYEVKDSTGRRNALMVNVDDDLIFENAMSEEIIDIGASVDFSYGTNVLFTDDNIDGHTHTIEGTVYINSYYNQNIDSPLHVWLEVCAVSRDTYLYLATVRAQSHSDDAMGFLSEPVQIHTNVNGGIGILGAVAPIRYDLIRLMEP